MKLCATNPLCPDEQLVVCCRADLLSSERRLLSRVKGARAGAYEETDLVAFYRLGEHFAYFTVAAPSDSEAVGAGKSPLAVYVCDGWRGSGGQAIVHGAPFAPPSDWLDRAATSLAAEAVMTMRPYRFLETLAPVMRTAFVASLGVENVYATRLLAADTASKRACPTSHVIVEVRLDETGPALRANLIACAGDRGARARANFLTLIGRLIVTTNDRGEWLFEPASGTALVSQCEQIGAAIKLLRKHGLSGVFSQPVASEIEDRILRERLFGSDQSDSAMALSLSQ